MTKKLKKAWNKTFKKWEDIIENDGENKNNLKCGLCGLFHSSFDWSIRRKDTCIKCPVYKINKMFNGNVCSGCTGTPFVKWMKTWSIKDAEIEYLFLLFVYEATKGDKD